MYFLAYESFQSTLKPKEETLNMVRIHKITLGSILFKTSLYNFIPTQTKVY